LTLPRPFGSYELLDRISAGGMAEVFRAREMQSGRIVALKKILPHVAEDEVFISMFADEARIVSRLEHPHIAAALDFGRIGSDFFIAFEYVHGRDLRLVFDRAVRKNEHPPLAFLLYVFAKIGEGLSYAHVRRDEHGAQISIVHRDVSPNNIVISMNGDVKLIDFGIAKAQGKLSRTQVGTIKGKFGYMSPEQVHGDEIDARTDVFSLGICLWELLTLRRLFSGDNEIAILRKIREAEVPRPSELNPEVPIELDRIVLRALAREADDRYNTARDMFLDLQAVAQNSGEPATRDDVAHYMRRIFPEVPVEVAEQVADMDGPTLARPPREAGPTKESRRASQPAAAVALPQGEVDIFEGLGKPQPTREQPLPATTGSVPAPPPPPPTGSQVPPKRPSAKPGRSTLLGTGPSTSPPAPPPPPSPPIPPPATSSSPPVPAAASSGSAAGAVQGAASSDHTPIMTPISAAMVANARVALKSSPPVEDLGSPIPQPRIVENGPSRAPQVLGRLPTPVPPRPRLASLPAVNEGSGVLPEPTRPPAHTSSSPVKAAATMQMDWDDEDEATHVYREGDSEPQAESEDNPTTHRRPSGRVRTANTPPASLDDPVTVLRQPPPGLDSSPAPSVAPRLSSPKSPSANMRAAEVTQDGRQSSTRPAASSDAPLAGPPSSRQLPAAAPTPGLGVPLSSLVKSGPNRVAPPTALLGTPLVAPPPPPPPMAAAFRSAPVMSSSGLDAFARGSSVPNSPHHSPSPMMGTPVGGIGASLPPGFVAPVPSATSPLPAMTGRGSSPPGYAVAPAPLAAPPPANAELPPEPIQQITEPMALPIPGTTIPPTNQGPRGPGMGPPNRLEATALVRPPRTFWGTGIFVAIALGLLAISLVAVFWFIIPGKGKLTVNVADAKGTNANHAEIFVDGKKQCDTSPCVIEAVTAGTHRVKVLSEGGEITERNVTTEARKEASIDFMVATSRGTGLRVAGSQPGLKLFVDGKEVGPLPQELKDLSPGEHKIRVAGTERYEPLEKPVSVVKDEMLDLGVTTLKVVRGKATITLGTPGAKVYLVSGADRRDLPTFPISVDIDTSKAWTLEATKAGLADYKQPISFADGQAEKTFNVQLDPPGTHPSSAPAAAAPRAPGPSRPSGGGGTSSGGSEPATSDNSGSKPAAADPGGGGDAFLDINSLPVSSVVLDGQPIGTVPKLKVPVKPGNHTVVFVNAEKGLKKTVPITVVAGESKKVIAKLSATE
jgi:serine/threonine protein kinase